MERRVWIRRVYLAISECLYSPLYQAHGQNDPPAKRFSKYQISSSLATFAFHFFLFASSDLVRVQNRFTVWVSVESVHELRSLSLNERLIALPKFSGFLKLLKDAAQKRAPLWWSEFVNLVRVLLVLFKLRVRSNSIFLVTQSLANCQMIVNAIRCAMKMLKELGRQSATVWLLPSLCSVRRERQLCDRQSAKHNRFVCRSHFASKVQPLSWGPKLYHRQSYTVMRLQSPNHDVGLSESQALGELREGLIQLRCGDSEVQSLNSGAVSSSRFALVDYQPTQNVTFFGVF